MTRRVQRGNEKRRRCVGVQTVVVVVVGVVAVVVADVAGRKQNVSRIMSHVTDKASVSMHVMSCAQIGAHAELVSEDFACPPLPSVSVSLPHASYQTCHLPV